MSGNSFGQKFRITTFGESHGAGIGVVIDGVPAQLPISAAEIQHDLDRRRPGQSHLTTTRNEADQVEILSGIFEGRTTGTPIALLIRNTNQQSKDYTNLKNNFRPGHADYTYFAKYGFLDYRGGGRSSGRETAARVAAGAIAKKILAQHNIQITSYTLAIHNIYAKNLDMATIEQNPVRCPDAQAAKLMQQAIEAAISEGDSLGGIIETVISNMPAGLGEPVFDKLDAMLAHAIVSIGAVKGIEFGAGFQAAQMKGSECNDAFYCEDKKVKTTTNHAGGILGGISNGQDIIFRCAVKPTPSISKPQQTINTDLANTTIQIHGRHDPCICPRIVPVIEAMTAITLVNLL